MGKAFNRLCSASLVSNLSDGVLLAAAPLLAITLTNNTILISLLGACELPGKTNLDRGVSQVAHPFFSSRYNLTLAINVQLRKPNLMGLKFSRLRIFITF
jgi:hypothetical protein